MSGKSQKDYQNEYFSKMAEAIRALAFRLPFMEYPETFMGYVRKLLRDHGAEIGLRGPLPRDRKIGVEFSNGRYYELYTLNRSFDPRSSYALIDISCFISKDTLNSGEYENLTNHLSFRTQMFLGGVGLGAARAFTIYTYDKKFRGMGVRRHQLFIAEIPFWDWPDARKSLQEKANATTTLLEKEFGQYQYFVCNSHIYPIVKYGQLLIPEQTYQLALEWLSEQASKVAPNVVRYRKNNGWRQPRIFVPNRYTGWCKKLSKCNTQAIIDILNQAFANENKLVPTGEYVTFKVKGLRYLGKARREFPTYRYLKEHPFYEGPRPKEPFDEDFIELLFPKKKRSKTLHVSVATNEIPGAAAHLAESDLQHLQPPQSNPQSQPKDINAFFEKYKHLNAYKE